MANTKQLSFLLDDFEKISVRKINILRSPKQFGTGESDSQTYLSELGINIIDNPQPIQFQKNSNEIVHRWSPYVQGFSSQFVQNILSYYDSIYKSPVIFDPFAGSGTVLVQSKLKNFEAYGVELNPLLFFIAKTKINTWHINPDRLQKISNSLPDNKTFEAPNFLKSEKHFNTQILNNLEILKSGIDNYQPESENDKIIKDLMLVAFSAILIDCSNLKRSPCLGYTKNKTVHAQMPFTLFKRKINEIASDLRILQKDYNYINSASEIYLGNSKLFEHEHKYDLVITSPPYMNGLDYVMNYKIEMGWLGFANNHQELKKVKDSMVVCDNVSKGLVKNFNDNNHSYTNEWIERIKLDIKTNIINRGKYRRTDMPDIVHKYFDDMYIIMKNVSSAIRGGGRFILVIGDSLIADVYLPTDLILARIGKELGLSIEKIEKARNRRSGQIRSYTLRESIVTLRKD